MDQKNEQKAPLRIKNMAELKRCIRPGTELVATSHSKHPALVGLVRVVTEVQTNAYYSVVKDQPSHQYKDEILAKTAEKLQKMAALEAER